MYRNHFHCAYGVIVNKLNDMGALLVEAEASRCFNERTTYTDTQQSNAWRKLEHDIHEFYVIKHQITKEKIAGYIRQVLMRTSDESQVKKEPTTVVYYW